MVSGKNTFTQMREKLTNAPRVLTQQRRTVFERFPLLFTLLGAAGFVATLHGFELVFDSIPFFYENPIILLGIGLLILIFTGTLYKKLR